MIVQMVVEYRRLSTLHDMVQGISTVMALLEHYMKPCIMIYYFWRWS